MMKPPSGRWDHDDDRNDLVPQQGKDRDARPSSCNRLEQLALRISGTARPPAQA
jgi:hypothetical protein